MNEAPVAHRPKLIRTEFGFAVTDGLVSYPASTFNEGRELAKLAAAKGVELSTVIDPDQAKTYQKLEKESGTDFDKEFLATIVSGHKKCVSNFEEASEEAKATI